MNCRVSVETPLRIRCCYQCGNVIEKGEKCLTFRGQSGSIKALLNLCSYCLNKLSGEVKTWANATCAANA